jgi:hypothetical protein
MMMRIRLSSKVRTQTMRTPQSKKQITLNSRCSSKWNPRCGPLTRVGFPSPPIWSWKSVNGVNSMENG